MKKWFAIGALTTIAAALCLGAGSYWEPTQFDVRLYGATGDGVTNDAAAIQAAINAAAALGLTARGHVVIPAGTYYLGTTGLTVPDYVVLRGAGRPIIVYEGTGFAVTVEGSYGGLDGLYVQVDTAAGQADYFGGVLIRKTNCQTSKNIINNCLIQGTATGSQVDPYGVGIYVRGAGVSYPAYFNRILGTSLRRWYRGSYHTGESNATYYADCTVEYYYLYGVDWDNCDENQMVNCFFQQAAGRSGYDLTYALHIGPTGTLNHAFYGAEPGSYGSGGLIENRANVVIVNNNGAELRTATGTTVIDIGDLSIRDVEATRRADVFDADVTSSELVTNGDFATDGTWTWGTGWAHDAVNLKAAHTAGNTALLKQSIATATGARYLVSATISDCTAGGCLLWIGNDPPSVGGNDAYATLYTNTTTTAVIEALSVGTLVMIKPTTTFDGKVDNISVKKVTGGNLTAWGNLRIGGNTTLEGTAAITGTMTLGGLTVSIGANDSGGAGYRILRIPNP